MRSSASVAYVAPLLCCLFTAPPRAVPQTLVGGGKVSFAVAADSTDIPLPQPVSVGTIGPGSLQFKLSAINPTLNGTTLGPNFVVVTPSQGTTPANVLVAANMNVIPYLPPGEYGLTILFSSVGASTPSNAGATAQLEVDAPLFPPSITSVLSAASLQPNLSPGEMVSIFGANIGTPPITSRYDDAGLYPTTLGNTTVTFGGTPAPLLYVSQTQVNAVVPFEVAGQKSVDVILTHDSLTAPTFSVPILDTSPSIFTASGTGTGQGAIQNATGPDSATPNGEDNPAPPGSGIAIYATGGGLLNVTAQDGTIFPVVVESNILPQTIQPAAPVSLTIGGQPAKILFAGAAPYEVAGMLQINATVPNGLGSGAQPVVLTIGNNNNASQQVTVAVK